MASEIVPAPPDPEILEKFLENVRGTIPLGIEQIDTILRLVKAAVDRVDLLLDAGGGPVLLSAVLDEYPDTQALVLDGSRKRLEASRQHLGDLGERLSFRPVRFERPDWVEEAAALAPYDLITCGVDLPLLPDDRQRPFFEEVYGLLRPGGFFLSMQYVASATRWTQSRWDDQMIEAIFGEFLRELEGEPRTAIARAYYEHLDRRTHHIAPLEVQCDWLREIGFESVECYLKIAELAVFGGQKPNGRPPNDEPC